MKEKTNYRWVVAVLILILPLNTMLPYLAMSVLMNDVMASLNIDYSLAGLTMTIMLAICGACMFVGSFIQDRIGIKSTLNIAIWFLSIGSAICFFSNSFVLLMLGRIVSGIGFGLSSVSVSPYMSTWFKGKERAFMITANLISTNVAGIIAYTIAGPLKKMTGSWRGVFGVYALIIAVIALIWQFLGKTNKELDMAAIIRRRSSGVRQESSFIKALKIKQYRLLMVSGIFLTSAMTAITAFLPSYITNGKGLLQETAITAASVQSMAYIIGSILGGILVARVGKRKMFLQAGLVSTLLGGILLTVVQSPLLIFGTVFILGIGYMGLMPAHSTIVMETPEPFDPAILGGASALTHGLGQIVSLVVSPLFSRISGIIGMSGALQIFFGLLIASVFISFMINETGPNVSKVSQTKEVLQ